jgi:hypothetical protein
MVSTNTPAAKFRHGSAFKSSAPVRFPAAGRRDRAVFSILRTHSLCHWLSDTTVQILEAAVFRVDHDDVIDTLERSLGGIQMIALGRRTAGAGGQSDRTKRQKPAGAAEVS